MNQKPIVSPREQELLDELEIIKRSKKKITIISFCKLMGYANKSALRHFPVLKRELSLYVAQFGPPRTKGSAPSAVKHLEVQVGRLNRELARLKREVELIPQLKSRIAKLQEKLKQSLDDKRRLQGMISTLIAFLSNSDIAKARDLSVQMEKLARALVDEENTANLEREDSHLEE